MTAVAHPARGASQLAWVVTAYMLASTITMPLAGKLATRNG